jgi:hypothetical protein
MSEYQYYEFRTDGRTLDEVGRKELRQLSSRAIVTSTQAIYTYSYSNFRYDCKEILADYFDIMLYLSNFGTRQLMIRLPINLMEKSKIEPYCIPGIIDYSIHENSLILDLCICDEEGDGWIEGEGILDDLIPIRHELLNGDFRALYLAWLASAQFYCLDDDDIEPPVPNNLNNLSPSLHALMSYFELSVDLVQAAAVSSQNTDTSNDDLEKLITKLSEKEKNAFLLDLLKNEPDLNLKLKKRLLSFMPLQEKESLSAQRTVAHLKSLAEQVTTLREEKIEKEKQTARIKELQLLAKKAPLVWEQVDNAIQLRTSKGYDTAAKLLRDLKDLSIYLGEKEPFKTKVNTIQQKHRRLSSFMRKLYDYELID